MHRMIARTWIEGEKATHHCKAVFENCSMSLHHCMGSSGAACCTFSWIVSWLRAAYNLFLNLMATADFSVL